MSMKIDLYGIDREQFNVTERKGRYLVTPSKKKHTWAEHELHLRSLLLNSEGDVLSSGLPKFFNANEYAPHDAEFLAASARGSVEHVSKLDGSLVILDFIGGRVHLRTRGNDTLGDFDLPVMHLIANKYPKLVKWYLGASLFAEQLRNDYSLLFEYVGPDNRIVLRYDEPELYLLGAINKTTLEPLWDRAWIEAVAAQMTVPTPTVHLLPQKPEALVSIVRAWTDQEGIVARFRTESGQPRMLKIKATQYLKLHGIKFRLEGKVAKLAFLLGVVSPVHARVKFEELGIDFEGQEFLAPELEAYLEKHHQVRDQWEIFHPMAELSAISILDGTPGTKEHRKYYVEKIRQWIGIRGFPESFFGAAMLIYDGKMEEAKVQAFAQPLMGESPIVVKNWMKNPQVAVNEMFAVPVTED